MTLREILDAKGTAVHTISERATVDDAVERLVQRNCGSLVVVEPDGTQTGRLLGIITERDILRACARSRGSLAGLTVGAVMTTEVVVALPSDSVADTMGQMTERRIRHLPVVEDGRLVGLVSIGDVVKAQHDDLTLENHYLKSYIHG